MSDLHLFLTEYRKKRNFQVESYVEKKCSAINKWFTENNMNSVVIGLSGGVDSSVAFRLLVTASRMPNSPIKLIKGMFVGISDSVGTTGQLSAKHKVELLDNCDLPLNANIEFMDIGTESNYLMNKITTNSKLLGFSKGQLDYCLRPAMFYAKAAYLQEMGYKSVVCGTINRDEGSYIGFFGKKTDTCDIQIISDLHKSEVIKVAEYLEIPSNILNAAPKGDVHTGQTDEQMIGVPYWFIELYTGHYLNAPVNFWYRDISEEELSREIEWTTLLKERHLQNKHKYLRKLDCVFIDVIERRLELNPHW